MKTSKLVSIVLLASALSFVGCKKKDEAATDKAAATKPAEPGAAATTPPPATPPAAGGVEITSDDDYLAKATAMIDKLTEVVKAAGTDCDKLADGITKLAADNGPQMASLQAYEKSHAEAKKKFDETSKEKTAAFEAAAGPAMTACQNNKKVGDAFEKLGG